MSRRRRLLLSSAAAAASLACLLTMTVRGGNGASPAATSTDPTQPNPKELMQRKLSASEDVLQGLVQGELPLVARAATELRDISRTDDWGQHRRDAVFSHFNIEFQRLSERLVQLAEQGNAEGAAWAHEQLTATCINCHRHVRDVKRLSEQ